MLNKSIIKNLTQTEQINFLLTNRIPRRYATLFMGWFSRIEIPLVRDISIFLWKLFADELNLDEAKKSRFKSMHDCFIRELKEESRPIEKDPEIIISPCDAIVGSHGKINGIELIQAKGFPYTLSELLPDKKLVERYRNGFYITLRLQSTMYHRFHAPCKCRISEINYISGDTWNVNPIALKRIERLYCKNERAVVDLELNKSGAFLTLVPVAAILVASIQLNFLDQVLDLNYKGPNRISCDAEFIKGQEMGYFQHGSTIIVFASQDFEIASSITQGEKIQMGQP
ncbi:MAG: archaetidylserine decarboxylase, partial [Thiohalomonadales bacterium]